MGIRVGIDLGASKTTVSVYNHRQGRPSIVSLAGSRSLPSAVFFPDDGAAPLIGEVARLRAGHGAGRVVLSPTRGLGDPSFAVSMRYGVYDAVSICALILEDVCHLASQDLDASIEAMVVTAPACFTPR